jgi:RNA polymerase sigma factor (sigma-70 family)
MAASPITTLLRQVRRLLGNQTDAVADNSLLERYVSGGDETAFATLLRRHGPLVWGVSRRVTEHVQDAEDVFQATFLLLARKAGAIRKRASIGSWLYGVAYRLALRTRADAARRRRREEQAAIPPAPDPSADVTWRELRTVLDEELARLPDRYQAPLLLCYFEGLTHEEAARQLGWSKRSVKDRLQRGRNRLRTRLARRGLTLSAALSGPMLAGETSAAPAALSAATVRAASLLALGQPAAASVSAEVLALVEAEVKTMFVGKFQLMTAVGLLVLVLGGAGLLASHAAREPAPDDAPPARESEATRVDRVGDPLPLGAVARMGTIRFRHGSYGLKGLAFLPDGKTLITATEQDQPFQFWDAHTGRLLRTILTGSLSIRGFALSPDGKSFTVGAFLREEPERPLQGCIKVWDVASGKEVRTLPRDTSDVDHCALAFSPDGKLLVSMGNNGALRIEEVATGVELLRHQFPRDVVGYLALSPDGSTLGVASGPNTHKLYVWKWQTGEEPREIKAPRYTGWSLCFSPDGKRLAECNYSDGSVRIWDVASGRILHQLEAPADSEHRHLSVTFSPDGKTLAAAAHGNRTGAIHLWDPGTGRLRKRIDLGARRVGWLTFSLDSRLLAVGNESEVRVWEMPSGKEMAVNDEAHQGSLGRVIATGNLVVTASDDHTIRAWDAATGKQRLKLTHDNWVRDIALSPDGTKLVSSSLDDTVCLWDVGTGRRIYRLAGHGRLGGRRAVGFSPDGKHFLSWGDDMYLRKWEVATGKALLEHALRPEGVRVPREDAEPFEREPFFDPGTGTFSRDGKTFVLNLGNRFHVFDVATGKSLRQFPSEGSYVVSLAISPHSTLLLASAWGKPIETKQPDGRVRYSSARNHPVCLWELASGKLLKQILLPEGGAGPVAFSADGKQFATATNKPFPRLQIFDVATGREVGAIEGLPGSVRSLAFLPDGKRLVSGMNDTTALVWDLPAKR